MREEKEGREEEYSLLPSFLTIPSELISIKLACSYWYCSVWLPPVMCLQSIPNILVTSHVRSISLMTRDNDQSELKGLL